MIEPEELLVFARRIINEPMAGVSEEVRFRTAVSRAYYETGASITSVDANRAVTNAQLLLDDLNALPPVTPRPQAR